MLMTVVSGFGIPPTYLHALARVGGTFMHCTIFRTALIRFFS